MDLLLIIVLAIGVYVAWRVLRQRSGTTTVRTEGQVQGPGKFACEVVGESKYQDHLERITGAGLRRARTSARAPSSRSRTTTRTTPTPSAFESTGCASATCRADLRRATARSWRKPTRPRATTGAPRSSSVDGTGAAATAGTSACAWTCP